MPNSSGPIEPSSSAQVEVGGPSPFVAQAAYKTWFHIDAVLSPIIEAREMTGLYKRSLSLRRSTHPLLSVVYCDPQAVSDYTTLRRLLAEQPVAIAMVTHEALLKTFNDLLSKLVGRSLTERLLRSALDNASSSGVPGLD